MFDVLVWFSECKKKDGEPSFGYALNEKIKWPEAIKCFGVAAIHYSNQLPTYLFYLFC